MTTIMHIINARRKAIFGFAALIIYIFHGWKAAFPSTPILFELEYYPIHFGDVGVDIFLFLSGMGLINSWNHCSSYKHFLIRRMKRILVPMIVTGIVFLISYRNDLWYAIKAVTGYYFLTGQLNTYLWFGFMIVLLYLVFPFYYERYSRTRSKGLFTLGVIAGWLLIIYLLQGHVNDWYYIFFNRIPIFLLGIYADHFLRTHENVNPFLVYGVACVLLIIGLTLSSRIKIDGMGLLLPHAYALFPYMMMSVSLILLLSKLFMYLPHRILDFYGSFTFEFYCVQERILHIFKHSFDAYPILVRNIILLVISTLCAYALHQLNLFVWKKIKTD